MATLTRREHAFGNSVGLHEIEELLLTWPAGSDADAVTVLDLEHCRNVDTGAGVRLANAMRRWAAGRLVVRVAPDVDLGGSDWFRLYTRSGIGLGLATHAAVVRSGARDIVADIREYYTTMSQRHAMNCVIFTGLESGALVPTKARFLSTMLDAVHKHLPLAHAVVASADRRSLARLAHEAVTNVVDHAFGHPWSEQGERLSYMSVRWYKTISASADELGGLRSYIATHRANLAPEEALAGWMEIVIADDGVGMASRQAQLDESSIFAGSGDEEERALREALEDSVTVKLRALDAQIRGDPGYGTTIMLECLQGLRAYAGLRTGRRLVEFDPWRHDGFELSEQELGWLPGTVVHVLLPVVHPQLRLV